MRGKTEVKEVNIGRGTCRTLGRRGGRKKVEGRDKGRHSWKEGRKRS